jgi:hypothetical protein
MEDDTENKLHGFIKVGGQFSPGMMWHIAGKTRDLKTGDLKFRDETARQPRNALSF